MYYLVPFQFFVRKNSTHLYNIYTWKQKADNMHGYIVDLFSFLSSSVLSICVVDTERSVYSRADANSFVLEMETDFCEIYLLD